MGSGARTIKRKFNKLDGIISSIMARKRGQVTIFIIIGILILATFSIFYYLQYISTGSQEINAQRIFSFGFDIAPIKNYIEDCLKTTSINAVKNISEQGGYYNLDNVLSTNSSSLYQTAYYFYEDRNLMPNKQTVEKEIENYIDDHILFCINEFNVFKEQGFNISFDYIKNSVTLNPNEISTSIDMPVEISKEAQKKYLKTFLISLNDARLGSMLETASTLIDKQLYEPDYIPLSYTYDVAEKDDFFIRIENEEDSNTYFFIIIDNSSSQKLVYANKYKEYSCDDLPSDADSSVIVACMQQVIASKGYRFYLKNIPDMNATVGKQFYYKVNASGLNLNFSDSTNLFDINISTGVINFTPTVNQIGNHIIWINVIDKLGKEDYD